jgi:exopolysaccharide biosynthesis polyprenyl glycosylphosphotransferase
LNKRLARWRYIIFDFLGSVLAWTLFYIYRKAVIEPARYGYKIPLWAPDRKYFIAIIIIPLFWLGLFWLFGSYRNILRKSRVKELTQTFVITFLGVLIIFFTILIDDVVGSYAAFRMTFFTLLGLQFLIVYSLRLIYLSSIKSRLKNRIIGFNTLLVGSSGKAIKLFNELEQQKFSQGYKFEGYLSIENGGNPELSEQLAYLGKYNELPGLITKFNIEEVILAVESSEHHLINNILSLLEEQKVIVKVIPDMYDLITGSVKMNYIFGTALIEIMPEIMPAWQKNLKRAFDIFVSLFVLIFFSPFYAAIAIGVKLSSNGPVFYGQERIGLYGAPFRIFKFRSMHTTAENAGPQLSSPEDKRVTPFGRFLRKYRIDEFPQFWNVLLGNMSLVGPRPERQFFIDQIVKIAPNYKHLHKVRPGITSWGQIKFGYAENVEQMVERMKFDILYIENMSMAMDFKILFYTVLIMLQGRGM